MKDDNQKMVEATRRQESALRETKQLKELKEFRIEQNRLKKIFE